MRKVLRAYAKNRDGIILIGTLLCLGLTAAIALTHCQSLSRINLEDMVRHAASMATEGVGTKTA
jgi:hypothetical protein